MKKLHGCASRNGEEIDGREFEVETLEDLIEILEQDGEVHLNYFHGERDLDLWVTAE